MTDYLIVDPMAYKDLNGDSHELLTWAPKMEVATSFQSAEDAKSWTRPGDGAEVKKIGDKWYIVKSPD